MSDRPQRVEITGIRQTPWTVDDRGAIKTEAWMEIEGAIEAFDGWMKVTVGSQASTIEELGCISPGTSRHKLLIPELEQDGDCVRLEMYADHPDKGGIPLAKFEAALPKVKRWTIYVAHDMHTDIGYTDYQEELKHTIYPRYLDEVFEYIEQSADWPEGEKFKYPIEASFMLYAAALKARDADWIQKLKQYIAEGRIAYPYAYVHFTSEGMGTEEIARQSYISARFLNDMLGTPPAKTFVKTDDAGFSWANIDALADAGCKYLSLRLQDNNWNYFDGHNPHYPRLFYFQGKNSENKLLTFDGPVYHFDDFGIREADSNIVYRLISDKFMDRLTPDYPYDAYLLHLTMVRDNFGVEPNIMNNIKKLNERKDEQGRSYISPKFINSDLEDFFTYIENRYAAQIPVFQGTIESFWNFGAPQVAHETALSRANHEKIPAAEFFATAASILAPGTRYPYEDLLRAYDDMLMTDEHTWANWKYYADDDQFNWMRNKAIEASNLADGLLHDALGNLNRLIAADGRTIVVYNHSSWDRSDIVVLERQELLEDCGLLDIGSGMSVEVQRLSDGKAVFIASNVPKLGYKCYRIMPNAQGNSEGRSIIADSRSIENRFFKVTLDETGSICSIVDKQNGNVELVDPDSEHKMNQYVYYTSRKELYENKVYSVDTIQSAAISSETGAVVGKLVSEGAARGAERIRRSVVLYEDLDRIDIVNEVFKGEAPVMYQEIAEEAFFTFPFLMSEFVIKHEMPTGEMRPYTDPDITSKTDQFFWSNTDFYTVNRWIDIGGPDHYGIGFSTLDASVVQYGGRRTCHWDKYYQTEKPWVYSWIYDNLWSTNFPFTQPGPMTFRYSIQPRKGADWKEGRTDKFGINAANPLKTAIIADRQEGRLGGRTGQFLTIDRDNVLLTTAKLAEANGEGVILRFNETLGEDTHVTVDLSNLLTPDLVYLTDVVENDKNLLHAEDGTVSFTIKGHGWTTLRLVHGSAPGQVAGLSAVTDKSGTLVSWESVSDRTCCFYEVFRDINADFVPGAGHYVASVSKPYYYDAQVVSGLKHRYYYKVRAAAAGRKGLASGVAEAMPGHISAESAPAAPSSLKAAAFGNTRVSLSWNKSDNHLTGVRGYKVYRDGVEIKDLVEGMTSFLNVGLLPNTAYMYTVRAYDGDGNLSLPCEAAVVTTMNFESDNIAPKAVVTVSSEQSGQYAGANLTDGIFGIRDVGEWVSRDEESPWAMLQWGSEVTIARVNVFGRYGGNEELLGGYDAGVPMKGILFFSDGSCVPIEKIRTNGSATQLEFEPKTVTWMKFKARDHKGGCIGLSEIQVFESHD